MLSRHVAIGLSFLVLTSSGCAALFASKKAHVAMQSTPSEAEVWVDGNRMGVTPVTLELSKKKSHTVTFKRDGYQDVTYAIDTKVGAGWIVLDVLGGLIPVIVDASSGSWKSLDTGTVNQTLTPLSQGTSTEQKSTPAEGETSPQPVK